MSTSTSLPRPATALFALGLAAIGALSVIYRDFAFDWQPVPAFPGRAAVAAVCGLVLLTTSLALLLRATSVIAARALLIVLLAWMCLKIPAVVRMPQIEGVWIGFGEVGMVLAGGVALFAASLRRQQSPDAARLRAPQLMRAAQVIFGLAVIPVGLSHIVYVHITTLLVPSWLPFRHELAYLTGIAQMLCGAAIVLRIAPRPAALIEASMVGLFAFLVWGPDSWLAAVPKFPGMPPGMRFPLTAFLITWTVGAAALLIADGFVDAIESPAFEGTGTGGAEVSSS